MPKVARVGKFRAGARAAVFLPAPAAAGLSEYRKKKAKTEASGGEGEEDFIPTPGRRAATKKVTAAAENVSPPPPSQQQPSSLTPSRGPESKQSLSRGQRKRQAKRDQYLRKEQMIMSALRMRREEDQRGRLDGLDAIRDALKSPVQNSGGDSEGRAECEEGAPEVEKATEAKKKRCEVIHTNRAKRKVAKREAVHMGLVLQHPAFGADPFGAIRTHLQNSLAGQAEEQKAESKARRKEEIKMANERKEAKKERIQAARVGTKKKWKRAAQQEQQLVGDRRRRSRRR